MREFTPPDIAHIALPLARTSGGIATVIDHLTREHAAAGGLSYVVHNRSRDIPIRHAELVAVDYTGVAPHGQFTQQELVTDALYGRLGRLRPFTGEVQVPAGRALQPFDPHVIVVHEGQYATSSMIRWRQMFPAACIVLYLHTAFSRSYAAAELRRLLSRADVVVCVSTFMANYLQSRVPRLKTPVRVVCNGTTDPGPRQPSTADAPPIVQFVGQVSADKGVHLLVQAATQLLSAGHDLHVRIVGSAILSPAALTPYEHSLRESAAAHAERFEWIPFVPRTQLDPLYRSATVACVPSQFDEPCPNTLLEALSYGLPTVVSRHGALQEISAGAAVEFDDSIEDLANAVLVALTDAKTLTSKSSRRAGELRWHNQYEVLRNHLNEFLR